MIKIATWNVNSIRTRMHAITQWLKAATPDIVCLQELKSTEETFPFMEIESLGYNVAMTGQKSYNGVAILSKIPFEEIITGLPGDDNDEQARYVETVIMGAKSPIRIASIYLPNGNPAPGPKFDYKLAWMERLYERAKHLLTLEEPLILAGDYNIIPEAKDCHDPVLWKGDALFRPESHAAFQKILNLGLTDAFAQMDSRAAQYTFWDYQGGAWPKNNGIRIDHLLLSAQAADQITTFKIDRDVRDGIKPSDHVPVIGVFDL